MEDGRLTGMLPVDVKRAFEHVNRDGLLRIMEDIEIDEDLMRWTEFFMPDRSVGLIIDGHQCVEMKVERLVPQGLPVSLLLFAILLTILFRELEKEVEEY